jgi:hypothetical protein
VPEFEEIKHLNTNVPGRAVEVEVKGRWLEQNPHANPADFDTKPSVKQWQTETRTLLEDYKRHSIDATNETPTIEAVDRKLASTLKVDFFAKDATYIELVSRFGDENVSPFAQMWTIPTDAKGVWRDLVNSAKQQVQRNVTRLGSTVETIRTLASKDIENAHPNDPTAAKSAVDTWEKSDLYTALNQVESAFKAWDDLLAKSPFPDRAELKRAVDKCDNAFMEFRAKHISVYEGETTVPFVKYQLLATMRALSEKLASQYAARMVPSFSGMYDRMTDVPRSGTYAEGKSASKSLAAEYDGNLLSGWRGELNNLTKELKTSDKTAARQLADKLKEFQPKTAFEESLKQWGADYDSLGKPAVNLTTGMLSRMHQNIGELSFGLQKCKETLNEFLRSNPSTTVQALNKKYQKIFDGFSAQIKQNVLICQGLKL